MRRRCKAAAYHHAARRIEFDITAVPGVKVPPGYSDYFKSVDGAQRTMIAEATGGPRWHTEFNVLTGMSARSFGELKFYVTRITANRVRRGLPHALQRCGYKTFSLYPTYGDFLSARAFQKGAVSTSSSTWPTWASMRTCSPTSSTSIRP